MLYGFAVGFGTRLQWIKDSVFPFVAVWYFNDCDLADVEFTLSFLN